MRDLRKRKIIAIKIKPNDSKAKDFHTALADYLYKELKYQGLYVKRNNVNLKIKLEKLHHDKYDHIVIDCHVGKLFLRGKEVNDKFFGKLRRFEGSRPADAYHCVAQSATRIVNRINKLMNDLLDDNDEREIYGEEIERLDLRCRRIDLRKTAGYNTDMFNRKQAICYIDGDIIEGFTHAECIDKYLTDKGLEELSDIHYRPKIFQDLETVTDYEKYNDLVNIKENISQLAFAHLINEGEVRLETDSLYNVDLNTVVSALKQEYPGAIIYDDNNYDSKTLEFKKIARDLRRKADIQDREKAILYADGELLEGWTHATCLNDYLINHNLGHISEKQYRPAISVNNPEKGTDEYIIQKNIKSIGFAHLINEGEVRVETNTLYNLNLNTFVKALKQKYPGAVIYDDTDYDPISDTYKKIAKKLKKKTIRILKDLRKKAYTNYNGRDNAILYIDGQIIEGIYHKNCIDKYIEDNPNSDIDNKPIAFAHKVNDYTINLDTSTMFNVDLNTVISTLKIKYPECEIFDDNEYDEIKGYKKLAKDLRRKAELIDAFMKKDSYIEIFLNPTNKEVEICKDAYFNGFRGVISHNGDMYIWGMDILHDSINDYAKINIDVNYIKFYVEGDIFYIYGNNKTSIKELKSYLEKFSNVFNSNYSYCLSGFNDYKELDIRPEQIYSYGDILNTIYGNDKNK